MEEGADADHPGGGGGIDMSNIERECALKHCRKPQYSVKLEAGSQLMWLVDAGKLSSVEPAVSVPLRCWVLFELAQNGRDDRDGDADGKSIDRRP